MTSRLRLSYAARTDRGRRRETNEDYLFASPIGMARSPAHVGHPWHLLAVADGVGGRRRGDWASHLAVSTLASRLSVWLGELEPPDALRRAFQAANQALWNGAGNQPDTAGAATTLVAVLVASQGGGWWANVGDSRAYLVDSGKITRLTQDHSWVEEQVRAGRLTMEQARSSGRRNVITRSIGGEPQVDVDVGGPTRLERGDVLVVCSDGLHGQVSDAEIAQVVRKLNPEPAADRLVELSNERGGVDNVSVIVCSLTDEASSLDAWVRSAYSALVHGS